MATQVAPGSRNQSGMPTAAPDSQGAGNLYLQALLPALQRLDQLLEWALDTMQSAGRQIASPAWRGLYIGDDEVRRLLERAPGESPFFGQRPAGNSLTWESPLSRLILSFNLSTFDADLILLAAAPDLDLRYERLYAYLQD